MSSGALLDWDGAQETDAANSARRDTSASFPDAFRGIFYVTTLTRQRRKSDPDVLLLSSRYLLLEEGACRGLVVIFSPLTAL